MAAPPSDPIPPMITTISELSRNEVSSPGPSEIIVPPSTPPSPASRAPRKNAAANTSCTLIPRAETMSRSSTPARTIFPKRVRLISHHSPKPISSAEHHHAAEEAEAHVARQVDALGPVGGRLDVLRDAAEGGQHLVGEDHRE